MNTSFSLGTHLLLDYWGAERLDDVAHIEHALVQAALACGAQVLEVKLHAFGEKSGVTGVALLAESHISIHTWPERDYAALDIFMCGQCNPRLALPVLEALFRPVHVKVMEIRRGEK